MWSYPHSRRQTLEQCGITWLHSALWDLSSFYKAQRCDLWPLSHSDTCLCRGLDTSGSLTGSYEISWTVRPKMTSKLDQCFEAMDLSFQLLKRTEEGIHIQSSLPSSSTLPPQGISHLLGYEHSAQGTYLNNPVFISDSSRDTSRHPSPSGSSGSWFNTN